MTPPMSKTTALGVFPKGMLGLDSTLSYVRGVKCSEAVVGGIGIPYRRFASWGKRK